MDIHPLAPLHTLRLFITVSFPDDWSWAHHGLCSTSLQWMPTGLSMSHLSSFLSSCNTATVSSGVTIYNSLQTDDWVVSFSFSPLNSLWTHSAQAFVPPLHEDGCSECGSINGQFSYWWTICSAEQKGSFSFSWNTCLTWLLRHHPSRFL